MPANQKAYQTYLVGLKPYLPDKALPLVAEIMSVHSLRFTVSGVRKSKTGDYRPPSRRHPYHRISVNRNLNPYQFLTTTLHELAHLHAHARHGSTIKAHGSEWKAIYRDLMDRFLFKGIYPPDLEKVLLQHFANPAASSCTDPELAKALAKYDNNPPKSGDTLHLEDLPNGEHFICESGRVFSKDKLLRKWFLCTEITTGKRYRFHPAAQVRRCSPATLRGAQENKQTPKKLSDLPAGTLFTFAGKAMQGIFKKGNRLRKYFVVVKVASGETYKAHPDLEISPVAKQP